MISYDRSSPLIMIHIPKAAGTSTREVFRRWFKPNFILHYFNEAEGQMPRHKDLANLKSPICIYGHFNRDRGFGVLDDFPDVRQFVTILRDPLELAISNYYYVLKASKNWKDQSRVPQDGLEKFITTTPVNMLNHFPRPVTMENYKDIIEEFFIDIGIVENLSASIARIAKRLGFSFDPETLEHLNISPRHEIEMREWQTMFREKHRLEYAVYDYVVAQAA